MKVKIEPLIIIKNQWIYAISNKFINIKSIMLPILDFLKYFIDSLEIKNIVVQIIKSLKNNFKILHNLKKNL